MPITLNVERADLSLESVFTEPQFALFRDTNGLLQQLFTRLHPHGLTLQQLKIERGNGSIGDFHVACQFYNFMMTVRVRAEKVETLCLEVPETHVERFGAAIVDALSAVKAHLPTLAFRTHTMSAGMHGRLEGESVKNYLSKFVTSVPTGLGPQLGNGGVLYFGAEGDRVLSSVTVDLSSLTPDGLFVRPFVIWDATKVEVTTLPSRATAFVRHALDCFGLEVPTLRPR